MVSFIKTSSAVTEVACIPAHRNSGRRFSKVSCNAKNDTIEPYYKNPKIPEHEFTSQEFQPPASFSMYNTRNILWIIGKSLFPYGLPMWYGGEFIKGS